jgi:N-acetylneuraminate lyase
MLAAHAAANNAFGVVAMPPTYFKPPSLTALVSVMDEIAQAAGTLPFFYYHIPDNTGNS